MEMPSVVHPRQIKVNGFTFEVVAYCKLTDQQAMNVVIHHCRTNRMKKKDIKKICRIITTIQEGDASLFG
jgi:hypothetical protein